MRDKTDIAIRFDRISPVCYARSIFVELSQLSFSTEIKPGNGRAQRTRITRYLIRLRATGFRTTVAILEPVARYKPESRCRRLSSRRDEMMGEGVSVGSVTVGAKETGCHQFRAWATKRNVDREMALYRAR